MTVKRWICPMIFFVFGLGFGIFWSPLGRPHASDSSTISDVQSENENFVAKIRKMYGEETGEFVKQFEEMTIRIKQYPIDAWAAPDGRFVIRLFRSDETIASDLRHPATGGAVKELIRHYSFSSGGQTFSCDIGRNIDNSKITNVLFAITDAKGGELVYLDSDADGRWDALIDRTRETRTFYERDGLCWKEREKDTVPPQNSSRGEIDNQTSNGQQETKEE